MTDIGVLIPRHREILPAVADLAEAGVKLVQLWCVGNELDVSETDGVDPERAASLAGQLTGHGVSISALCCDTNKGFVSPGVWAPQLATLERSCELAKCMGVSVVTSHIGSFSEADASARQEVVAVLRQAGDICDKYGVTFATETGVESGPVLSDFLREINHDRIRVNFDPANLIARGYDLREAIVELGAWTAHAHAKDARAGGSEVAIGSGDVPFASFIRAIRDNGYRGPFIVEREITDGWREDALSGFRLLDDLVRLSNRELTAG